MSRIVVLATGGTIAGQSPSGSDSVRYTAAQLDVHSLLQHVAGLSEIINPHELVCEQVLQRDSKDMDIADWQVLLQRCLHWLTQDEVQGIVITHGTDTAEESAYFLHTCLRLARQANILDTQQAQRPVVLTCAMRPATARLSDGAQNLADACTTALHPQARGVLLVCAGVVHGALEVCKTQPYQLSAFADSGLAPYAYIEASQIRWLRTPSAIGHIHHTPPTVHPAGVLYVDIPHLPATAQALLQRVLHTPAADWPWVDIVTSHGAAQAQTVHALTRAGVRGLVLAGTGNATIHHQLEQAARVAVQQHGLTIWRSSRCQGGQVVAGTDSPFALAAEHHHAYLSPVKARIALMLYLLSCHAAATPRSADTTRLP